MGNLSFKSFDKTNRNTLSLHGFTKPEMDVRAGEVEFNVELSSKVINMEAAAIHEGLMYWPSHWTVVGHGRNRFITVDAEYLEDTTNWMESHGCNWQE